jgi:hypothetical protein
MSNTNNPMRSSFNNIANNKRSRALSSQEKGNSLPRSYGNHGVGGALSRQHSDMDQLVKQVSAGGGTLIGG